MALDDETVVLPLIKGLDLTTDDRLLMPPSLLEATNTTFNGGGAKKRRGHTAIRVRSQDYGGTAGRSSGEEDTDFWLDDTRTVDQLLGSFSRDSETVVWDGVSIYSHLPSQSATPITVNRISPASLPGLTTAAVAKYNEHQSVPEMADNGSTRVVAWVNEDDEARYAIYDSDTGAEIALGTLAVTTAHYIRCFTIGNWMHVAVRDSDDGLLKMFSVSSSDPNTITYRSYGEALHFDIVKTVDGRAVLARTTSDRIYVVWLSEIGAGDASKTHHDFAPTTTLDQTLVSIATTNVNDEFVVAWYSPTSEAIGVANLNQTGYQFEDSFTTNASGTLRLTVANRDEQTFLATDIFDLFWDDGTNIRRRRVYRDLGGILFEDQHLRYHMTLASRAFGVGDRTFVWGAFTSPSGLQSTWFLLDEALLPVGKLDFAVANTTGVTGRLAGINWTDQEQPHLALSYKLRVNPDEAADGIYTEPAIRGVYLDFFPEIMAAQAGRCTYVTGAQLWCYDGRELVEQGFHLGPEATLAPDNGGSLTALGTYSYRIDLCHRNAQNEEVRSLSILTDSEVLTGTDQTINVTFNTVLTRRTNSYFLIYRNAMSSGVPLFNWWLLNSRDPDDPSYRPNDLTVQSYTFVDDGSVSDTEIQTRELHPASDTYIHPISAPACSVIAAGRDRLWLAGGELLPGQVAPSRLFEPGDVPAFSPYLYIQVDRSSEPVTAIGFVGEIAAFFRENSIYILDSDGPDNNTDGSWNPPRLVSGDIGAVSQNSVARIVQGLIFQSPAGFRLLGPGGSMQPIGGPVDTFSQTFDVVGTLVVEADQEVRFYGTDETLVYNYLYDTWARWTCGGVGVTKGTNGLAIIARDDANLWVETADLWTDAGAAYTHRIRTSWLHRGNLGDFQRVRRIGGIGRYADLDLPDHNLRMELYYDSRGFWEDRHEWTYPDSTTNDDDWGDGTWGAGVWGDTSATVSNLEDLTWDWQRDPAIQKCGSISIALEDYNTTGPGFVLSALSLEIARKPGLFRGPERTGTGSYRSNR